MFIRKPKASTILDGYLADTRKRRDYHLRQMEKLRLIIDDANARLDQHEKAYSSANNSLSLILNPSLILLDTAEIE